MKDWQITKSKRLYSDKLLKTAKDFLFMTDDFRLIWKVRVVNCSWRSQKKAAVTKFNKYFAGKPADGHVDFYGYRQITINNIKCKAHKIVWAFVNGDWPCGHIDHIDGNPANNEISNLRIVDQQANRMNSARPSNNTSGFVGVRWHKQASKWCASIKKDRKNKHIGLFVELSDAVKARIDAEKQLGFHCNHGRETLT